MTDPARWNHNLHHHRVVLDALPAHVGRALDVGCGEGTLLRQLATCSDTALGLDRDDASLRSAAGHVGDGARLVRGDLLAAPFPPASFDAIATVAMVHHVGLERAVAALADLLRPGGTLVVIGIARSRSPMDFAYDSLGFVWTRWQTRNRRYWLSLAPVVDHYPETYRDARRIAGTLPGARYRRHVLFRYSITWTKPVTSTGS